jgi:hypothetical protein
MQGATMALTVDRSIAARNHQGQSYPTALIGLQTRPLIRTITRSGCTGKNPTKAVWPEPRRSYAAFASNPEESTITQTHGPLVRVHPKNKRVLAKQPPVPMRLAKAQKKSSTDTPKPANQTSGKNTPASTTPPPTDRVYGFYRKPSREMPTPAHLRNVTRAAGWDKHTSEHWSLPDYMDRHARLNYRMRTVLVDWLVSVTELFRLSENTFNLAVTLLDRTLACVASNGKSTFTVKRNAYQCYGW